jgi:hypothetical protein
MTQSFQSLHSPRGANAQFALNSDRAAFNDVFDDDGWKLSTHSINSWVSKIFLAQHVAERILNIPADPRADKAHADWLQLGCPSNPGIDQIFEGATPEKKFFYPRAITSYLWGCGLNFRKTE